jgi:cell division protein FtsI/penicillin-binding protein 2
MGDTMHRARLAAVGAAVLGVAALGLHSLKRRPPAGASSAPVDVPALAHPAPVASVPPPPAPEISALTGLDLLRWTVKGDAVLAPTERGTAKLTLDPGLQTTAAALMRAHHLPEAAVVLMDTATGRVLVYASHVDRGDKRDLCAEASAPSASVFKVVTAAALVEDAHLTSETKQCYSGGEQRINAVDLVESPQRDRWCTTLAGALGRSINTVFARLANAHLAPAQLETMARRFGYGESVAFDVPVQPSALHVPVEPLAFARTAAGFWNTSLSPVGAAEMSAVVARRGESVRPTIVETVSSDAGATIWSGPSSPESRRVIADETASELETMMARTISEGTSYRAFHDGRGRSFLPGIAVAGKTGTLTDGDTQRYYTWFTGFAPAHVEPGAEQVAIAALVINGPTWELKANVLARDVLRAYFKEKGTPGVTAPATEMIARRRRGS